MHYTDMNSQNKDQLYMNYTEQGYTQNTNTSIKEDQKISVKSLLSMENVGCKGNHLFYCPMIVIVVS